MVNARWKKKADHEMVLHFLLKQQVSEEPTTQATRGVFRGASIEETKENDLPSRKRLSSFQLTLNAVLLQANETPLTRTWPREPAIDHTGNLSILCERKKQHRARPARIQDECTI